MNEGQVQFTPEMEIYSMEREIYKAIKNMFEFGFGKLVIGGLGMGVYGA